MSAKWCGLLAGIALVGCDSFEFSETYTLIEVRSSATGEAIVGADVTAGVADIGNDYVDTIVAPTNSHGQTHIPVRVVTGTQAPLRVSVNAAGRESTLSVMNRDGSVAENGDFIVAVLSADADPPPPPLLAPIWGSNPPQISIHGYVRVLEVCNNRESVAEWAIGSVSRVFLDIATVGNAPEGYEDATFDRHTMPPERTFCWAVVLDGIALPTNGFSICAVGPFGNSSICGGRYCLGTHGEAIPCED